MMGDGGEDFVRAQTAAGLDRHSLPIIWSGQSITPSGCSQGGELDTIMDPSPEKSVFRNVKLWRPVPATSLRFVRITQLRFLFRAFHPGFSNR